MVVRIFLPGFVELFVRFGLGIDSLSRRPEIEILPGFSVPNRRGVKERIHWKAGIDIHRSPCPFLVNASSVKLLPSTMLIDYSAGSRQNLNIVARNTNLSLPCTLLPRNFPPHLRLPSCAVHADRSPQRGAMKMRKFLPRHGAAEQLPRLTKGTQK